MSEPHAKNELDKIRQYESEGYTANYVIENGKLKDTDTGKSFDPDEVDIVKEYRYEGMSNPSDMSMLHVVQTADGGKGLILIPYGPNAHTEMVAFLTKASPPKTS